LRTRFIDETLLLAGRTLQIGHGYAKSESMPKDQGPPQPPASELAPNEAREKRPLPAVAERALAEAAARHAARANSAGDQPKEIDGRDGPDPTRYGDWEVNGLASDF
jgi:hypothetical protein